MIDVIEPSKDIAVLIYDNPALAILDSEKFEAFYELIKSEAEKISNDATTQKGRDEIRSMAFKIAKSKTAIDKARLGLTEDWRKKTKQANEAGKEISTRLDDLAQKVRAPLTQWEEIEKQRTEKHEQLLAEIKRAGIISIEDTSEKVNLRLGAVVDAQIDPEIQGAAIAIFDYEKERAIEALKSAYARLLKEEADRAELERLRKEAAEREAIEAEKRAKEEAEAKAEADRIAEEKRLELIRQEAAENAKAEQERKHAAALAIERDRADRIERQAKEQAERKAAEAAKEEADRLAREQNQKHRSKIMGAAKEALIKCGLDEEKAREIVLAIAAGNVPNVSIKF